MGIADNTPQKGYCIYAHLNPINDHVYIGLSKDVKKRWESKEHGYKHCEKIYSAFKKYGWDNFYHIVMWDNLSYEEACKLEKTWISLFKLANMSYNLTDGGEGRTGCSFSEDAIKKIREASTGRRLTLETREKISKAHKEAHNFCKKVYAFDLNTKELVKEYISVSQAAVELNAPSVNISAAARGKYRYAAGYIWSFSSTIDKDDPRYRNAGKKQTKEIYCYDLYGNYIRKYDSAYAAAKEVGGNYKAIHACCHKDKITYMNYIWRYSLSEIEPEILNKVQFKRHETYRS